MAETPPGRRSPARDGLSEMIGAQEQRKLRAIRMRSHIWSGLGMLGLVGWSIGVPTLLGTFLGLWLDKRHPGAHSWTLSLLFAGLCLGCINTWRWITREQREIHREGDDT